jgi:signal transduction histidine kinase
MNLFSRLRGAVRRHAQLADAAIAIAVFAAAMVTAFAGHPAAAAGNRAFAAAAAAVGCGALALRRRHPVAALVVSAVAAEAFLHETSGSSGVLILLAPCVALYTVAELADRRRGLLIGGCAIAALAGMHTLMHMGMLGTLGPQNLALTALGGLAIAAGDSSRNRRAYLAEVERRAERAELEREQDARRRIAEERLRIARDLHDSVGHHLALISVQSDVAGRAVDGDAASAREALGHVKSASRKALEELRDTVGLLRQPGDPVAPTEIPAPGLEALGELLTGLRATGLAIDCQVEGTAVALAPAADRTAYRVIQESLTNVRKHSAGRQARLTLGYDRRELRITVDDLGGPTAEPAAAEPAAAVSGGQHGIAGMRERVLALGGQFSAGPCPGMAFHVAAALPYQAAGLALEPRP